MIRYAQLYSIPSTIEVCCNRGTSGIDGSLSTAVGCAAASDKLNFVAIGDLSFFYDMNALWNVNVRPNLRILLLNNGGGEIFRTLPELELSTPHEYITGVHKTSAKGWAEERGFLYLRVDNEAQLPEAVKTLAQPELWSNPSAGSIYRQGRRCANFERLLSPIKIKTMSTKREWTTIREYEDILFDYYNGIARITINRERYRNAFTLTTTAEMSDALRI